MKSTALVLHSLCVILNALIYNDLNKLQQKKSRHQLTSANFIKKKILGIVNLTETLIANKLIQIHTNKNILVMFTYRLYCKIQVVHGLILGKIRKRKHSGPDLFNQLSIY